MRPRGGKKAAGTNARETQEEATKRAKEEERVAEQRDMPASYDQSAFPSSGRGDTIDDAEVARVPEVTIGKRLWLIPLPGFELWGPGGRGVGPDPSSGVRACRRQSIPYNGLPPPHTPTPTPRRPRRLMSTLGHSSDERIERTFHETLFRSWQRPTHPPTHDAPLA